MNTLLHKSEDRGNAQHGWLDAWHSFSFASYHDPKRMGFGTLRVLNDDTIAEGMGFGEHGHENMEIVTIPLHGQIEHKDSMGNGEILSVGEVQIMSAGTGIRHSEFNPNDDSITQLFQIWVFPRKNGITPDYGQRLFDASERQNTWQILVAPEGNNDRQAEGALLIHQDAWFSRADLQADSALSYSLNKEGNGIYLMVIEGSVEVNGQALNKRDALGITDTQEFNITASQDAQILAIEIPMS